MARIGVFDSGIGGFSILREIMSRIRGAVIDYISDEAFAPYGNKIDSEIVRRSEWITGLLIERGADLIVVACNSATAASIAALREEHPDLPFVGVEPYINVLNHGSLYPDMTTVAVVTTVLTGNSSKFRELKARLDPNGIIRHFSLPGLATLTEEIIAHGYGAPQRERLAEELKPLKGAGLSHLILGCTHYPLIADLIEEELEVKTISPAPAVAQRVVSLLGEGQGKHPDEFSFMSTTDMIWRTRSLQGFPGLGSPKERHDEDA
ncbi:MAG TPA: aspartate/glutamate racemase family protein [Candidatus Sabulitectum sp.]|nr:aspartate/glutamate racemase family protein [Candidatus Sabulitectum sp.]HPJ29179.1 aspartate/glutamate racemase family protein [Candidatus Sabulitectum sp.]HPR23029.1 aspartate/glutamate racemase family protein [Candidatus Sabulitectum sp.]